MTNRLPRARLLAALLSVLALCAGLLLGPAPTALAADRSVTNTAHLDFLLDTVTPPATAGHSTYQLDRHPTLTLPWTYADARPGGTFARIGGGGPPDAVTGYYLQGAFNSDDVARAAVVYLRHWQQTGDRASRQKAYELLRGVTYFQTTSGKNRGQVVLWMQPDGTLNPSAKPVELPDPSDSGPSYWMARTIWALGEGYAAFAGSDPAFASFLQDRLQLSVGALNRHVLVAYGRHQVSDGRRVPAWLIVNGADVSAEAALGLSAYVAAAPHDATARKALRQLLEGVAEMATSRTSWPYGAILPWAESRSMLHAWSSQMAGSLARGSAVLNRPDLLRPAVTEAVSFDPTLITTNGPDNAWYPTPVDTTQIAYGIDSRVQNLLATADVGHLPGLRSLAAMDAAWFFGANRAGAPLYDPATGVTYDGLAADGTINRNSGAESTIHGLLTMLALDAHPAVRTQALGWRTGPTRVGLSVVEAETAATDGTPVTPASAWTGESQYSGGAYLHLSPGQRATVALPKATQRRVLEPVSWLPENGTAVSRWATSGGSDTLRHRVGDQGLSEVPGALLPLRLDVTAPARATTVAVTVRRRAVDLDAVIVRPQISRAVFTADRGTTELLTSIAGSRLAVSRTGSGLVVAARYDKAGRLVGRSWLSGSDRVWVEAGGFTVVTG
ncbi:MAG: hypothetical protein JWP61_263 [Friedmanniella sp.]|nr:hypothetical protein [Friedmanniella sp.]